MSKIFIKLLIIFISFYSNSISQMNYFPLNIGDYYNSYNYYSKSIAYYNHRYVFDTISVNSKKYYLVSDGYADTIRIDEMNNVIVWRNGIDYIRFKLNGQEGDTWVDGSTGKTIKLISKKDSIITEAGLFKNCYKYCIDYPSEKYTWLAPNIGQVKSTKNYSLANYRINNSPKSDKKNISGAIIQNENEEYFPIGIGNYYYYYDDEGIQGIRYFTDSVILQNKKYYLFIDGYIDSVHADQNNNIYYKDKIYNRYKQPGDQLYFKLNSNIGDTWNAYDYGIMNTFIMESKNDTVICKAGVFSNCSRIRMYKPGAVDSDYRYWLAPGIGIVRELAQAYDRRLYNARVNGIIIRGMTSINKAGEFPYNNYLYQNYPNPFNPATIIKYDITNPGFTSLKVYDLIGREITTLVNEYKIKGNYFCQFDASNLSTGIYFYILKIAPENNRKNIIIKKSMIVIK
jgi:hypothetical protein